MPTDNINKLLNLFCIVERGHVRIEPSWQSWIIFCIFLVGTTFLALSGVYFQVRFNIRSAIFCFTLAAAGIGMVLVTFLAILLGCFRRRRYRLSNRNDEECLNNARASVSLDIEKNLLRSPRNSGSSQQWMNPVYADCNPPFNTSNAEMNQHRRNPVYVNCDQFSYPSQNTERNQQRINPVYVDCNQPLHASHKAERKQVKLNPADADHNKPLYAYLAEKNLQRIKPVNVDSDKLLYESNIEPCDITDFEEQLSDYFLSSSETRTCFYNTDDEDDDYDRESDLSELYGRDQSYEMMVKQNGQTENERVEKQKMVPSQNVSNKKSSSSFIYRRDSGQDLPYKMTSLQMPDLRSIHQLSLEKPKDENFFNRNSLPVKSTSDCNENIIILKSSFDSNSVDNGIHRNLVGESNDMKMHRTECQNHHNGKHQKTRKNETAANLKPESPTTVKQLDKLQHPKFPKECQDTQLTTTMYEENGYASERCMKNYLPAHIIKYNSFYFPKPQEICFDSNQNSVLLECNRSVIDTDDSQSTVESCNSSFQSNFILSQNANKTVTMCRTFAGNGNISQSIVGGKRWKWSERNEDIRTRIKKRPLLDVNGNPISQYELVKVLTELLKKGQQLPKHTVEKRNCKKKTTNQNKTSLLSLKH